MIKRLLIVLAVFLSWFGLAESALAQSAPDVLVKNVTTEVLTIIKNDKELQSGSMKKVIELVDAKILPHFNFTRMTSLAVGQKWREATPEQKTRLAAEFKVLLVRTYANALTSYKNQTIDYKPLRMAPTDTDVTVKTEVRQANGQPIQLDYALQKKDDGWKVYDVVVAGVSLVTNYRDSFGQEIRNGGIEGLIASLATKNQQASTSVGKAS